MVKAGNRVRNGRYVYGRAERRSGNRLTGTGRFRYQQGMDAVEHPLEWWALGGYPGVTRVAACSEVGVGSRARAQAARLLRTDRRLDLETGGEQQVCRSAPGNHGWVSAR